MEVKVSYDSLEEFEQGVSAINERAHLFISSVREIEELTLEIIVDEAKPQKQISLAPYEGEVGELLVGSRPILTDDSCRSFLLVFPRNQMVVYQVLNESYGAFPSDTEAFTGKRFRTFSRSHLLEYIKLHTQASDAYPGLLNHYQIVAENHGLDVIMTGRPTIIMDQQRIAARRLAMMGGSEPDASAPPRRRFW